MSLFPPTEGTASTGTFESRLLVEARRPFIDVREEPYGAALDGVTNDATALQHAADDIAAAGGGTLWIDGHAAWTDNDVQGLSVGSNTTIRGTPGVAKIDFSGGNTWRFGSDDACVLVNGALSGSTIALTRDAKRQPTLALVPTSITRSGAVATATMPAAHGLGVGDYVYIRGGGSGSSLGQNGFYTETNNGVGADPIRVDTVADSTHFTFAIAQSTSGLGLTAGITGVASTDVITVSSHGYVDGDTLQFTSLTGGAGLSTATTYFVRDSTSSTFKLALTLGGTAIDFTTNITAAAVTTDAALLAPASAHIAPFGKIVVVSSTAGLAEDDMISLSSNATRTDAASELINLGQSSLIARVVSGTVLLLKDCAQDDYLVSDGAVIQKITPVENAHFEGIEFIGKGSNLSATGTGDKGLRIDYARSCSVMGCTFRDIDLVCLEFRTTLYCHVGGKTEFICPQSNVSGRVSGHAYVQYGLSFANGTEHLTVDGGCMFHNFRHGIVQASTSARPGVSRNVTISGCHFFGAWLGAISTHQGFEAATIADNHFVDCQSAINIRYGERTIIHHNDIVGGEFAIIISKHWSGVEITDNMIDRCWTAISTSSQIDAANVAGIFKVRGNTITNCESPIDIRPTIAGTLMRGLEITHNYIERSAGQAILVQVGDSTSSADGFSGTISHNTILTTNLRTAGNAIQCTNARGVRFIGNEINTASNMNRGIFCDGAATSACIERASVIVGATTAAVDFSTGTGHSSELVPIESVTIVGGSVTPRYRNRIVSLRVDIEAGKAATGVAATDVITVTAHGYASGTPVVFRAINGGAGLVVNTVYFVRDVTTDTFKLALTVGGAAIDFTTDIVATSTISASALDTIVATSLKDGDRIEVQSATTSRPVVVRNGTSIKTVGGASFTIGSTRSTFAGRYTSSSGEVSEITRTTV